MKLLTVFLALAYPVWCQLIFTEVMFDLPGRDSPNEFVEIFNNSDSLIYDLTTFEIRDGFATDQLVALTQDTLPPKHYALILEGDYPYGNGLYDSMIPPEAICFMVDDLSIGNGLSTVDSIYLLDSTGQAVDSLGWDSPVQSGYSFERIYINGYTEPADWSVSRDSLGTPGRTNSNTPPSIDGTLISAAPYPEGVFYPGEPVSIGITYTNSGITAFSGTLALKKADSLLATVLIHSVPPSDTGETLLQIDSLGSGFHMIRVTLTVIGDEDTTDNALETCAGIRFVPLTVRINEFMPDPGDYDFEFIELYSVTEDPIDLDGWKIRDKRSASPPITGHRLLLPEKYCVIASDSSFLEFFQDISFPVIMESGFPALNNSGDSIILVDPFGTIIDSLYYDHSWGHEQGRSLEKVLVRLPGNDPENWAVSRDPAGLTPGRYNSRSPRWSDGRIDTASVIVTPEFPEEFEPFEVSINIVNAGEGPLSGELLCRPGEDGITRVPVLVRGYLDTVTLKIGLTGLVAGSKMISFDLQVPGDTIPDNVYDHSFTVRYPEGTLLLNEFLPVPGDDMSEFVEIIATRILSLKGWSLTDLSGTRLVMPDVEIGPGDYFILASDSSILDHLARDAPAFIASRGWPSLNNESDSIVLTGPAGGGLEGLAYDPSWSLTDKRSLERISTSLQTHLRSSWETSVSESGFTPGSKNSIFLEYPPPDGYRLALRPNPFSPDNDGIDDRLEIHYFTPLSSVILSILIFSLNGVMVWNDFHRVHLPGKGIKIWDGLDRNDEKLPVGIYIIKAVFEDPGSSYYREFIKTAVLARQL